VLRQPCIFRLLQTQLVAFKIAILDPLSYDLVRLVAHVPAFYYPASLGHNEHDSEPTVQANNNNHFRVSTLLLLLSVALTTLVPAHVHSDKAHEICVER
jgi:hypothetical protein